MKKPVTMKFSDATLARLAALQKLHELSATAIVEQAIREKAEREGIDSRKEAEALQA